MRYLKPLTTRQKTLNNQAEALAKSLALVQKALTWDTLSPSERRRFEELRQVILEEQEGHQES